MQLLETTREICDLARRLAKEGSGDHLHHLRAVLQSLANGCELLGLSADVGDDRLFGKAETELTGALTNAATFEGDLTAPPTGRKRLSSILRQQSHEQGFPIIGQDGYAGEQDGSRVCLSEIQYFSSKAQADEANPAGVPAYVDLHWATYRPGSGWQAVFGWWSNQPTEGDGNPFVCAVCPL